MKSRTLCKTCNRPLLAFKGRREGNSVLIYLHPSEPCAGIVDQIDIEATIDDEFLQEKFVDLYGEPEVDDYERIGLMEEEISELNMKLINTEKKLDKPLFKFLIWFASKFK